MKKVLAFLLLSFAVLASACPVPARADEVTEQHAIYADGVQAAWAAESAGEDWPVFGTTGGRSYILTVQYIGGVPASYYLFEFAGEASPYYAAGSMELFFGVTDGSSVYKYVYMPGIDEAWNAFSGSSSGSYEFASSGEHYFVYSDFDIINGEGTADGTDVYFPCTYAEPEPTPELTPEPTAEPTPEPSGSGSSPGISQGDIDQVTGFFGSLSGFFQFLSEVLQVLFPFFTAQEINFLITMLVIFLGVLAYFFIRKVFI